MNQKIEEKISWQSFLLAFGITAVGVINYREYNTLKKIYRSVNSERSIPSKSDSVIIEKIRSEVIDNIRISNLFNKFNKSFIIDSISRIEFRVVDSIDFTRESSGCYINIKSMKELRKNVLLDVPSKDNYIIIERSVLHRADSAEVISHEIYHYFDYLLGSGLKTYSKTADLDKFADKSITKKEYALGKISILIGKPKKENDKYKSLLKEIYDNIISDKDYYNKPSEIFARYKTLKHEMIRMSIINNINSKVGLDEIANLLYKYSVRERLDILPYLFYLDLRKLEELDKVI